MKFLITHYKTFLWFFISLILFLDVSNTILKYIFGISSAISGFFVIKNIYYIRSYYSSEAFDSFIKHDNNKTYQYLKYSHKLYNWQLIKFLLMHNDAKLLSMFIHHPKLDFKQAKDYISLVNFKDNELKKVLYTNKDFVNLWREQDPESLIEFEKLNNLQKNTKNF